MKSVGSKLSQSNEDLLQAVGKKSPSARRRDIQNTGVTCCETEATEHQQVATTGETVVVEKPESSEAVEVLLKILLQQEELTLEEYTLNSQKFKVLVIEDTEF